MEPRGRQARAEHDQSPRRLRFGVIGLGRAAMSFLPALVNHPHVEIRAGADPRPGARAAWARDFEAEVYESAEELCRSPSVDAVYIATPHEFHAPHVIAAAQHGKHAICEKPMALTLDQCDAMIAAVHRAGTKLVVGHSQAYSPPIFKIREIVRSGELGRLGMINTWNYKGLIYTPRRSEELDPSLGGGVIYNQGPHQVDIVRWIGGGRVRSVRSMVGVWDRLRPVDGAYAALLEFDDGAAASLGFSAYGRFDTDEFHFWIGEGGQPKQPERYGNSRRELERLSRQEEADLKAATGYGGARQRRTELDDEGAERYHPHFGVLIVSCERGDLRPSAKGVFVYDDEGRREIPVPLGAAGKIRVVEELYDAVVEGRPVRHDGLWGKATLEVCLAILRSGRERREVFLSHQVPTPD